MKETLAANPELQELIPNSNSPVLNSSIIYCLPPNPSFVLLHSSYSKNCFFLHSKHVFWLKAHLLNLTASDPIGITAFPGHAFETGTWPKLDHCLFYQQQLKSIGCISSSKSGSLETDNIWRIFVWKRTPPCRKAETENMFWWCLRLRSRYPPTLNEITWALQLNSLLCLS